MTPDEAERNKEKLEKPDSKRRCRYGCSANFCEPRTFERAPNRRCTYMELKRMNLNRRDFHQLPPHLLQGRPPSDATGRLMRRPPSPRRAATTRCWTRVLRWRHPLERSSGRVLFPCPHGKRLEPTISAWMKGVPNTWPCAGCRCISCPCRGGCSGTTAPEALNLLGEAARQHLCGPCTPSDADFRKPALMADWVAAQGVDKAKFMDQYNSFTTTATKMTRATQLTNAPTRLNHGRGRTPDGGTTKGKSSMPWWQTSDWPLTTPCRCPMAAAVPMCGANARRTQRFFFGQTPVAVSVSTCALRFFVFLPACAVRALANFGLKAPASACAAPLTRA